jgi:uncharacterized membrane protein
MSDWRTLFTIGILGLACYAMRVGGFMAAGAIRKDSVVARFLRLAPGNLFIAFVAAACFEGGWPSVIGCTCALVVMAVTRKEWAALGAGFAAAALAAALHVR